MYGGRAERLSHGARIGFPSLPFGLLDSTIWGPGGAPGGPPAAYDGRKTGVTIILAARASAETTASSVGARRQWQYGWSMDGGRVLSVTGDARRETLKREKEGIRESRVGPYSVPGRSVTFLYG